MGTWLIAMMMAAEGLLLAGPVPATEPVVTITPRGTEGFYYPDPPVKKIGDWCLDLYPMGDGAEKLTAGIILAVAENDRRVIQCRFEQVQLEGTELSLSGCKIRDLTVDFTGIFVASDPFIKKHPRDEGGGVALRGTVSVLSGKDREVFENIEFTYDSGY
jgi:hypothetical protein